MAQARVVDAVITVDAQMLSDLGLSTQAAINAQSAASQTTELTLQYNQLNGTPLGTTPGIYMNPMGIGPNWPGNYRYPS
jgi:hypothetical protein